MYKMAFPVLFPAVLLQLVAACLANVARHLAASKRALPMSFAMSTLYVLSQQGSTLSWYYAVCRMLQPVALSLFYIDRHHAVKHAACKRKGVHMHQLSCKDLRHSGMQQQRD